MAVMYVISAIGISTCPPSLRCVVLSCRPRRCTKGGARKAVHERRCTKDGARKAVHERRCTKGGARTAVHERRCTKGGARTAVCTYECVLVRRHAKSTTSVTIATVGLVQLGASRPSQDGARKAVHERRCTNDGARKAVHERRCTNGARIPSLPVRCPWRACDACTVF